MMRYAVVLLLFAVSIEAATPADIRKEIDALKADVQAVIVMRDAMARDMPGAGADGRATGLLKLTATKAVAGTDLTLFVLRKDGVWTQAWAVALDWNPIPYRVEVGKLNWDGTRLEASLTVRLVPWIDRHMLRTHTASPYVQPFGTFLAPWGTLEDPVVRDGLPVPVKCRLVLDVGPRGITGTMTIDDPSVAPVAAAKVAVEGRWIPAGPPTFAPFPKHDELSTTIFGTAVVIVDRAQRAFEQIRAMELQKRTGLPATEGVSRVPRVELTWPDPAAKPDKGRGKITTNGPKAEKLPDLDEQMQVDALADSMSARNQSGGSSPEAEKLLASVGVLRRHVANLTSYVKAIGEQQGAGQVQRGDVDPGDPYFGPFDFCVPIARNAAKENVLPPHGAGTQAWPCLDVWKVLGPFPLSDVETWTQELPDLVPDYTSLLVVEKERFPWKHVSGHQYWGDGSSAWRTMEVNPADGVLTPPIYTKKDYAYFGINYGGFYAVTVLVAPVAGDVWAAMRVKDRATLWVNDRPVWTTDNDDDYTRPERLCRFRIPLRQGANRLMVRCDANQRPQWFSMRVNISGSPCPAAEVKTVEERIASQHSKTGNPRVGTMGLRGDGTGIFANTDPPLAWDLDSGMNVRWRANIGEGTSGVLVWGDRVFATAQPYDLVCLDAATGATRWRQHIDPSELYSPDVFAKAKPLVEAIDALKPGDDARRDELIKELKGVYQQAKGMGLTYDRSAGYGGMMLPTPVTDGRHIWVKAGPDVLACFDFEGNRKWFTKIEHVGGQIGAEVPSPVLAFGRLYMQVARYTPMKAKPSGKDDEEEEAGAVEGHFVDHRSGRKFALASYDPETGKRQWLTDGYETLHWGNRYDADGLSSPMPLRLGDGQSLLDVILMPNSGTILRADDGKLLLADCGAKSSYPMPIQDDEGTLYYVGEEQLKAIRLVPRGRDRVEALTLFTASLPRRVGALGGLVRTGDRLWLHSDDYFVGCDKTDGRVVVCMGEIFRRESSEAYMPPVLAGGAIYIADTGRNGWNKFHVWKNGSLPPEERVAMIPGVMSAIAPGKRPLVLARNAMWGVTSSPVAEGARLYVRSHRELYCLERTGEAGARYEGERVIRALLAQIPPAAPAGDSEPLAPKAVTKLPYEWRTIDLDVGLLLVGWSIVGPVPQAEADAAAGTLGFPATPNFLGKRGKVPVAGRELDVRSIVRRNLFEYPPKLMVDPMEVGPAYDLALIHTPDGAKTAEARSVSFWTALLNMERAMTLRLELAGAPEGTRMWIGGEEVRSGQRVRLDRGNYALSLRVAGPSAGDLAPFRPVLWPALSPETETATRRAIVAAARPWLKRAIDASSGSAEARAADAVLAGSR